MTTRRYVLALDQGTTGSTALVVDPDGRVRARGYAELPQYFPRPGWVEHDPEEIWATVERAARAALAEARIVGAEVAAIGIANQRETTMVWDRAWGPPIHRAIVGQCRRTAPTCDRLRAQGVEPLVRDRTGLVLDAYFSGTKIRWLLDEVPGARVRAERGQLAFGTVDAWLLWKLTGGSVHGTDASNASRTLCLNLKTGDWDDELLKLLGVPRAVLPVVLPSAGTRRRARRWRARSPTRRASTSCRPSSGSAPRTGTCTRAGRSSGSRAERQVRTWPARRSRPSPSRAVTCWRRWRPTAGSRCGSCAWTGAPRRTTFSVSSRRTS